MAKKKTKRVFLVDFENTRAAGFVGINNLSVGDEVHIFFSEHVAVLPFAVLPELLSSKAKIEVHKVYVGTKNALDFQLSSFLGFQSCSMGDKEKNNTVFVIVSHDCGYNVLIPFWAERGINVSRKGSIAAFDMADPFVPFVESLPTMARNVANSLLARGMDANEVVSFFALFIKAYECESSSTATLHSMIMKRSRGDMAFTGEVYRLFKPMFVSGGMPEAVIESYRKFF